MAEATASPNIAICVASHLYYDNQLNLLDRCLQSLTSQTEKADIVVAISFANQQYKQLFATHILRKYARGTGIKFKFSNERKSQMKHILNVMPLIRKHDLIMFCDDDDTYHKDRVRIFSEYFQCAIAECSKESNQKFAGLREYKKKN
eukprot:33856_1